MDQHQPERIRDDLKGIVKGQLLFDELSRVLYSTDASIFQIMPLGIVVPRDEEDVQILVRYAAEHRIPLIPRGAGSGVSGESLGAGLIIDLSQNMRGIVEINGDSVRVQPGVVHRSLNAELAKVGRRFAPDPASGAQCTIGGMAATNASGARAIRHGYTRDHVETIRVVFNTGECADVGREPRWPAAAAGAGRVEDIVFLAGSLLEKNTHLIRDRQPRTRFNRFGYMLDGVLTADHVDLAKLLIGSEGTLGLFTELTLRTVPLPAGRCVVFVPCDSVEQALRVAQLARGPLLTACEMMDRRLLTLARSGSTDVARLVPAAAEAVLLVEFEADAGDACDDAARVFLDQVKNAEPSLPAQFASEPNAMDRLWELREAALPSLYGLRGGAQPTAFVEDIGVPPETLPEFLHRVQDILQRHETIASFFIHAATGQVHTRPFIDLQKPEDLAKLRPIADQIYEVVLELGGTLSSQHGTGLARTPWLAQQYGPLYSVFCELKTIFDPLGIFNPGKIVGPAPAAPVWPLRSAVKTVPTTVIPTETSGNGKPVATPLSLLQWRGAEFHAECVSCNGCGACRTETPSQRMCPIFRAGHAEAGTPRAKANLLRHLLTEAGGSRSLADADVRAVADLCVNCKMCASECPAHVNIPKLMLAAKAANVAEFGLDRADWVLARTEGFARFGSAFSLLTNTALSSRSVRWLLERFFGVSRKRRLPRFAYRSFLRRARRRGWTRRARSDRPRLAYFVDVFANYNDPTIAEAVLAILQHNGFEVHVPEEQEGCGMAPLAYGDVETARESVERNVHTLAELVRDGYEIICSEPTAALMLRHDALDLLDSADAHLVAAHTAELTAFLWDLHAKGRMRTDFQSLPLQVGHHVPCHVKALGGPARGPDLLALIPSFSGRTIDVNCSGMAGTFGLKASNYETSLAAGQAMLAELKRDDVKYGSTECSTCRMQMEDGAGKRTLHPAQYLALAYGLMPELAGRLRQPMRGLVL